ncbi:hypothetical protein C6P40_004215 [Pichia californica]|uniref:Uncharacterized protein n=1 Tax=Pichia californica TaxID=460514 RepID=A0A9P6WQF7_9ASCO|nr:hypothetical protein C6P42_002817 [[Candida] californica]KAG0689918.1 hypothetical protein C6P40_004215 [[Candida] californica]
MFNPLSQLKLISDELLKGPSEDPNKLGIIEALLLKFLFAFVLCFCIYVYLDKTSSLNGRSPEENKKLHKMGYVDPENEDNNNNNNNNNNIKSKGKSTTTETSPISSSSLKSRKT